MVSSYALRGDHATLSFGWACDGVRLVAGRRVAFAIAVGHRHERILQLLFAARPTAAARARTSERVVVGWLGRGGAASEEQRS